MSLKLLFKPGKSGFEKMMLIALCDLKPGTKIMLLKNRLDTDMREYDAERDSGTTRELVPFNRAQGLKLSGKPIY